MIYYLYEWLVMLIAPTRTLTIFIYTINDIFSMLYSTMVVFLDIILVYSFTVKEYFMLLEKGLAHLYQYTIYCRIKKFSLLINSTIFLGFNITPKAMQISDLKV